MGIFDKIKGALGGGAKREVETIKGPTAVLREAGIDPSCVDCRIGGDGTLTVSGTVGSGDERDRIVGLLEGIPHVSRVVNEINVAEPAPAPVDLPGPEETGGAGMATGPESAESAEEGGAAAGRTYTVQSGDTLWKIAKDMYGDGSKYMKIFEANGDLLDDPNKIFPGQTLQIPDLDG